MDGRNRRLGTKVNGTLIQGFLYDDQLRIVAELDGANQVVAKFIYADGINVPELMEKNGRTYRLLHDHLGSPRLVVDTATGEIAQELHYDAWGNVTYDSNPGFHPFGFAGGLYDRHTRLVRFGARDYDPQLGRWTAKDPIGLTAQISNLLAYVNGDSLNYVDPGGDHYSSNALAWATARCACALAVGLREKRRFSGEESDKYRHCVLSCKMSLACGGLGSLCVGVFKEMADKYDRNPHSRAEVLDMEANLDGIDCSSAVVLAGFAGQPCSCEDCCCSRGHRP